MADDPKNQRQFAEDVAAYNAASDIGDNVGGAPYDNFEKMPSVDEVWKMIEQMEGMSDEEKAELKENLYNPTQKAADDLINRMGQAGPVHHTSWDYMIFFVMIGLIMIVFALFGFKLYKSLMEKERKKQEKLKSKQAKKTKKTN